MEYLDQTLNQPPWPSSPSTSAHSISRWLLFTFRITITRAKPKKAKIPFQREVTGEIKTKETGKLLIAEKVKFMNKKGAI